MGLGRFPDRSSQSSSAPPLSPLEAAAAAAVGRKGKGEGMGEGEGEEKGEGEDWGAGEVKDRRERGMSWERCAVSRVSMMKKRG